MCDYTQVPVLVNEILIGNDSGRDLSIYELWITVLHILSGVLNDPCGPDSIHE